MSCSFPELESKFENNIITRYMKNYHDVTKLKYFEQFIMLLPDKNTNNNKYTIPI